VIHSTTAIQAIHDRLRSTTRISCDCGNTARSTRTVSRITASEISTGSATLNTAAGTNATSRRLAANAKTSASSGNSAPSIARVPSQIEPARSGPLNIRTMNHARPRQPSNTAASASALGLSND
jgi:hypothetical protein